MAGTIERFSLKPGGDDNLIEITEAFAAPASSDHIRFQKSEDGVFLQLAGDATSITAVVERCTQDPGGASPNWAPAMSTPISGDLSAGIAPMRFREPARGWWRVRITAISGGSCTVYMAGELG